MVDVSGRCETIIVESCDMDGSGAATRQMYGVSVGGFQSYRIFDKEGLEVGLNQETIRVANNVFRNMDSSNATVYLSPWDMNDIEIIGNTFINCSDSISIYNQEQDGCFDPFTPGLPNNLRGFDKRKIPDVVRIAQNTIVDSGRCYISCGGIVLLTDNIFTRKYQEPYTIAPFFIDSLVGRVGRVIRRNNRVSGLVGAAMYAPNNIQTTNEFSLECR